MSTEEQEATQDVVSEHLEAETQETHQEEPKMVPLAALQAERRKRQDLEARTKVYEELMERQSRDSKQPEEQEDPEALVTKGSFQQEKALTKREILEQVYQDMNPAAVQKINTYLKPILDKKPWLASTLENAVNRLARANEIVDDYMHLVEEKPRQKSGSNDAKRIIENAQKPRSPNEVGKSAQTT